MYCSKCGKEIRNGDQFCSGCGAKLGAAPAKKGVSPLLVIFLIGVIAVLLATSDIFSGSETAAPPAIQQALPAPTETTAAAEYPLPEAPEDGDVLEESDYADGTPRRRIDDYGDIYISDYRPNGLPLRDTILYYNGDTYGGKRVTDYDAYGNPSFDLETMPDGSIWMYIYYQNDYDAQGRPLRLSQYNRAGSLLCTYDYTYNSDGSYTMEMMEYRGPVYEYDFEENPEGTTAPWCHSVTTFSAQGDLIDQQIDMTDGAPVE